MSSLISKGTGIAISASTASANTNAGPAVNTWQFVNTTANAAAVNLFTTNSNVTMTNGIVIPAGGSQTVTGDFGMAYGGNVWVTAILSAGTGTVYATPVASSN